jgi:hypothetical protein
MQALRRVHQTYICIADDAACGYAYSSFSRISLPCILGADQNPTADKAKTRWMKRFEECQHYDHPPVGPRGPLGSLVCRGLPGLGMTQHYYSMSGFWGEN